MSIKTFLVRCKPDGVNREDEFIAGRSSIGWGTGPNASLKDKSRSEMETILNEGGHDITSLRLSQIYNFVTLPIGSIIITPSLKNRDIHIFRTISTYEHDPERFKDGNPHGIRVRLIKTVSREVFSEQVQKSMKAARKTVSNLTKYSADILKIVEEAEESAETIEESVGTNDNDKSMADTKSEARKVLKELLKSENEEIRLKAAELLFTQN